MREGEVSAAFFKTFQNGAEPEASARLARHFSSWVVLIAMWIFIVVGVAA